MSLNTAFELELHLKIHFTVLPVGLVLTIVLTEMIGRSNRTAHMSITNAHAA